MKEENALEFSRLNRLANNLFFEKDKAIEDVLALKSQIRNLEKTISEHKNEIAKLHERLKKQEFLEKSKEIQKESVKIVANKAKKSTDNVEIKKTIADLVQEIDACIALLNED
ncbi:hypothetical protein [Emticicia aquatica]|nr:hypothetical protein [Emticicia aquatica]